MRKAYLLGVLAFLGCHHGSNPAIGVPMIATGFGSTVYKQADGSIWAWGYNDYGELGDGTNESRLRPVRVGTGNDWATVSANGGPHVIATKEDGSIWGWGLGVGCAFRSYPCQNKNTPTLIGNDPGVREVAAVANATFELKDDGTLSAWGDPDYLGAGNFSDPVPYAVQVGGQAANEWASIPTFGRNGLLGALKRDGTLWTWGRYLRNPVRLGTATDWRTIGGQSAIKADGTLWTWGAGCDGSACQPPAQVGTDADWEKLSSSGGLALKKNGTLWNLSGATPSQVGVETDWDQIAGMGIRGTHFLAMKKDGSVWAWGRNDAGQLGLGDTQDRDTPTRVVFEATP